MNTNVDFIVKLNRVDLITLSSVLVTFIAIINAIEGHLYFSMALLFVAMTADALDGMLARKLAVILMALWMPLFTLWYPVLLCSSGNLTVIGQFLFY
jgi:hypothetical protein